MIKPVGNGKFVLMNKDGTKKLYGPASKEACEKRERVINYFKHMDKIGKKK